MIDVFLSEIIFIIQGIAVMSIYIILWNELTHIISSIPMRKQYILLIVLMVFMFLTSKYSFYFIKEWGI